MINIAINNQVSDNEWLKKLIIAYSKVNKDFHIMCWNDEKKEISYLEHYGRKDTVSWNNGTIFYGKINYEFVKFVTSFSPPGNIYGDNRMTPFFTIQIGEDFWCEHYGTEINIINIPLEIEKEVKEVIKLLELITNVNRY